MAPEGGALVMKIQATGAELELEPWTAMFSRSTSCRAIDLQKSQKISVRCRSDSSNFESTRTPSLICWASPLMTARPLSSDASSHLPANSRC